MSKFVIGTILSFVSALLFALGTYLIFTVIGAQDAPEAISGIILIPLAIGCYVAQFIFGGIGQALLWVNVAKNGRAKIASVIVAIISVAIMLCTVAVLVYAWTR